jgi:hypothetical protein
MMALRYILFVSIAIMGFVRLRWLLILLGFPETYTNRDIVQEYLMAKAILSGINPYQPLNELIRLFVGNFPYFPHQAPYPPFVAILSIPLSWFSLKGAIITWFIFEIICVAAIAFMLTILWKGQPDWKWSIILFFILLAWYPVMNDLYYGQLSILLTVLLLAALLTYVKGHKVQAGVLIGISISIKLITWPLIIYFILKKDWRTVIATCLTTLGLNLVTLFVVGINPFLDYLKVTTQVTSFWRLFWSNTSLLSFGYRLFEGTKKTVVYDTFEAPPLINLPGIAPFVSISLVVGFLLLGLILALRTKEIETSFAILLFVIVLISPVSWDHYFVMITISLFILWRNLTRSSFPIWQTISFLLLILLLFFFNEQIYTIVTNLNGGKVFLKAHGNQITFSSSLLSWVPLLEMIILTFLLWRSGLQNLKKNTNLRLNIIPKKDFAQG